MWSKLKIIYCSSSKQVRGEIFCTADKVYKELTKTILVTYVQNLNKILKYFDQLKVYLIGI